VRIAEFVIHEISGRAKQFVLLGCGQGSLLALELAARMRSEISGLVLISPPTEDAEFADGLPRMVKSAARTKVATKISSALLKAELGDFLVRRAWHGDLPDEVLDKYRQATKLQGWSDGITALIKNYKKREIQKRILQPRLIRAGLPLLVLVGANDRVAKDRKSREFCDCLRQAGLISDLHVLDKCGHVPHEEHPDQVALLIDGFLTRLANENVSFTEIV
jgi:pimeloyl-ACP methyl ester carboxylesterase